MKKALLILFLILCSLTLAQAQQNQVLSVAAANCSTTGTSCLIYLVDAATGGGTLTVSANASGNTIAFESTGDGGKTWVALSATPSNGTSSGTSTTSTGTWQVNLAGYTAVRMRMSTLAGGTTTVSIITSLASARSGGGGGTGVTSFSGDGVIITNSASNGAVTATIAGTSGGIPCFNSASTWQSSAAITAKDAITGGGAGACAQDSNIPVSRGGRTTEATNLAIGTSALGANGSGTDTHQTAIGVGALATQGGSAGSNNAAVGWNALNSANDNGSDTAFGSQALSGITNGAGANTGVGATACNNATTGNSVTCFGATTRVSVAGDSNEIAIGQGVTGAGSNTATVGNASVTDHFVGGATGLAYENSAGFIDRGSTPTITGTGACATVSTQSGGATAGTVKCTGTTGASTMTITFAKTAPAGWTCDVWDETTRADNPSQTSHSQTTCVVTATAIAQNDVLVFKAFAW